MMITISTFSVEPDLRRDLCPTTRPVGNDENTKVGHDTKARQFS